MAPKVTTTATTAGRLTALLVLITAVLLASFAYGIRRGMHRMIPDAVGRHTLSMAVAISDLRYGLKGYVAYNRVIEALSPITNDPERLAAESLTPDQALRDGKRINTALRSASSLRDGAATGFYPLLREDKGLAVYYKLAFRLFGYRVEGFYYLYFLLLGISAAAYGLAFRGRTDRLHLLLLFSLSHLFLMSAAHRVGLQLASVVNARFMPVLGILPALHLAFLILGRRPATPALVLGAAVQAALLSFTVHMRAGATALVLFLATLAALTILRQWRRFPELGMYARNAVSLWPLALAIGGLIFLKAHLLINLHGVHSGSPNNLLWFNFYAGLGAHPDSFSRHGIEYDDNIPFEKARTLAREKRGILIGIETHNDVVESVLREEYFRIMREDPAFFAENYLYKLGRFFKNYFGPSYARAPAWLLAFLAAGLMMGWRLAGPTLACGSRRLLSVLGLCFVFALIPTGIAMPEPYLIAAPAFLLTLLLLCAASIGAVRLIDAIKAART